MYGWRARLGILVPSGIIATEPEFALLAPEGVVCHFNRYRFAGSGDSDNVYRDLKESESYIAQAVEDISHIQPSVVAMVGTATTFIGGYGYDHKLIQMMQQKNGGIPTTTTSTSVIAALNKLGIKKVSVGMPYFEDVARAAIQFVEDSGVKVVKARWLNKEGRGIWEMSKETIYQLARDVDEPESEAIFISCVNLHTLEVIDKLECDLKKPVLASNQATMWNILRLIGINDKLEGYGQLFSKY